MRDVLDSARQMAVFLRSQDNGYLAAFRLLRAARWDVLAEVPPCDGSGKTRLAPPRDELRQYLKRLLLQRQWGELLERVEMAFAEGANHFWLDLQHYAWQGQRGDHHALHRDMLLADLAQMLDRLPGLHRLAFSDGFPFADDSTLMWLASNARIIRFDGGEKELSPLPSSGQAEGWAETESQAQDLVSSSGLEAAFSWLRDLPRPRGESHRARADLLMARLADQAGRQDMAISLYDNLMKDVGLYRLDSWEPDLAFEICLGLFRLLERKSARKTADNGQLAERMEALASKMTTIDPVRTLAARP
jgi:type VI secretion system protein VasJ